MPNSPAPLVSVERGEVEEAIHLGHLAVVDADDQIRVSLGDPHHLTYFRSCSKPLQALGSLRAGIVSRFRLGSEHLAVMCASHNAEPKHLEVVRDLLSRAGIPESALQCGPHWPLYEPAAAIARRELDEPLVIFNNCSGKHAGMLAGAVALGAPLETYLDLAHPVQQRISGVIADFTRCAPAEIRYGIDGCSAPNPAVPLSAMARSFAALVTASETSSQSIVEAMTRNPYLVGGTGRLDTALMEVTQGRLLSKGGAAGAHCVGDRRSGLALAIKFDSGDGTWIGVAVIAAMERLDWLEGEEQQALANLAHPILLNRRKLAVGTVEPVLEELPQTLARH